MADELDIYDDLDNFQEAEDQKSKELLVWETKFANAQVEIGSYRAEKKALEKKIKTMEVNFQNLLDTAKAELKRKDTLIAQLRKEKDDICFRRKIPGAKPEKTEANPFKVDQRTEIKHLKGDETLATAVVAKKSERKEKEIKNDKQKPQEIVHEKKLDHKHEKRSSAETTATQLRATDSKRAQDRAHERERERDREREREREQSRRRSRSRNRSRHRSRSRERNKKESKYDKTKESQRSRRSRSKSVSRSRSSHRHNSNKTSTHISSNEREREREKEKERQNNKEKTMETLFGNTPKHQSPAKEQINEQKDKVMQQLLANTEPLTPKEQYTPQREITTVHSEKLAISSKQTEEEINDYFVSNANETEETPAMDSKEIELIPGLCLITDNEILISSEDMSAFSDLHATKSAAEDGDRAITPEETTHAVETEAELIVLEIQEIKASPTTAATESTPRGIAAASATEPMSIPGLGLVTVAKVGSVPSEEDSDDVHDNELASSAIENEPQTIKMDEQIPGLDLITDQDQADLASTEQLDQASNESSKITIIKPITKPADKAISGKVTDNEEKLEKVEEFKAETEAATVEEKELSTEEVNRTTENNTDDVTEEIVLVYEEQDHVETEQSKVESEHSNEKEKCNAENATTITEANTDKETTELLERSTNGVQIIENIRLSVMMDIEDIALRVDGLSDCTDSDKGTVETVQAKDSDTMEQSNPIPTAHESEGKAVSITDAKDSQSITDNENEMESNAVVQSTILLPKPTILSSIVMYAQPDSTKFDHNEEPMESLIIPAATLAKSADLSQETDNIDRELKQLHQQSYKEEQPDEATVTSTSMKALNQDLITILTQSPVLQQPAPVSPYPAKSKNKGRKAGARSASERTTPTKAKAGCNLAERGEKTPLKKRKLNLDDKKDDATIVLQTPPDAVKTTAPSPQNVTIDETLNASSLDGNHSFGSDSSTVTKRCSLGQSDYQFERINDEVVLRVTRRGRRQRRVAETTPIAAIKET